LNHHATPEFWQLYRQLPAEVSELADRCFERMNANPRHPSIQLKKVGEYWVARVGLHYRTLGVEFRTASRGSGSVLTPSTTRSSANKQLQRTVMGRRVRGACASLHFAHTPRIRRQRAAAELRRYAA